MEILCDEREELDQELFDKLEELLGIALKREMLESQDGEVSLSFVSQEEISQLNRDYRGIDRTTDVLSFPQYQSRDEIGSQAYAAIGDVIICKDVAVEQAKEYGHSLEREICYLFVHSILHLLGYDHMEDGEKAQMRQAEEEILSQLGISR